MRGFAERGTQALPRQFQESEAGQASQLNARAVHPHGIAQHVLHRPLVRGRLHVDEIDDDQAADVAQPQLAGDFLGGLEVGVAGGGFDVATAGAARRVDVDGHQGFRVVDDQAPPRRQGHLVRIRGFDLTFDLIAREQGHGVLVQLELALCLGRHEALHVLLGLLEGLRLVDQTFADVVGEVIAQSAGDRVALLEDQEGSGAPVVGGHDGVPGRFQVVQIPLQLFGGAADPGRAHDGSHAVRDLQCAHRLAHLVAVLALDPPRYAARARVVGHEHEEAARQTDERREGGALVAPLLLFDLHDQFLSFLEQILDVHAAAVRRLGPEVFFGYFLQRQEAMALRAVFDERRFEAGFYAGDPTLVDVGFLLFPGRDLNR